MRTLIRDAAIVTVDAADTVLPRGDLVIENGRLAYVGPPDDARRRERYDAVFDGARHVAMPGLVNAHTHTYATLFKGSFERLPLDLWLVYMRSPTGRLSDEQLYLGSLVSAVEMLRTGTTTCLDHFFGNTSLAYGGMPQELAAMDAAGMRAAVAYVLADLKWEDTLPLDPRFVQASGGAAAQVTGRETAQGLEAAAEFFAAYQGRYPRISLLVGPSAAHRLSDAMLAGCRALADRFGIGLHLHVGEAKSHAVQAREAFHTTLVGRLDALGVLGPDVSMAHCVWLDDDEFALAASRGATIIHNPASNLKLGSGVARVRRMRELGVNVAVATDGPCSSDNFNMFEALRLTALLHTSNQVDYRQWPAARDLLRMATINGARACGLQDEIGSLEVGKRADVVLLRRDSYALAADNDLPVQLVYCENGAAVDTVFVDGEIVVREGRCTRVDEQAVYRQVSATRAALQPGFAADLAAAAALEPAVHEMWQRLAGWPLPSMAPGAWFA
ncbi:MAG TPA: amidohydrolase [Chloroflexota bacterium]|nr:amidohydrolase [Chloroflexota bacterium]